MGRPLLAAILAAVFLTAGALSESGPVRVGHVIDGDTIVLENGEHVRLIGMDAPEYRPWKNIVQPYGREAGEALRRLVEGRPVRLESDLEKQDRYGRALAYVYLEDGRMANRWLVREGLARARYYPPNGAHRAELESDQREARAGRRGVWSGKDSKKHDKIPA